MSQVPRSRRSHHRVLALGAISALLGGGCGLAGRVAIPETSTTAATSRSGSGLPATTRTAPEPAVPPPPRFAPTAEVVALARSMSDEGRRIFYDTNPTVLDRTEFASVCPTAEHAQVLGCFTGDRIHILRVARPELAGVMETTAVHEMLHAVYSDMRPGDRAPIDRLVDELYGRVADDDLRDLVASYERSEPGQRLNELHSILPTQIANLGPRLEDHYRRYVAARQEVVAAHRASSGVLEELERRIDGIHAEIDGVKGQLGALEAQLGADKAALAELDRRLEALRAQGSVREYNRLIPQQNAKARELNLLGGRYNRLVEVHNAKVREVNGLALEQNQLVDSLEGTVP